MRRSGSSWAARVRDKNAPMLRAATSGRRQLTQAEKLRGIGFDTFKLKRAAKRWAIDNSRAVDAAVITGANPRSFRQ